VRYALTPDGLAAIRASLAGRTLLSFDIDGTLAPIVERPWDANVPEPVQRDLARLAAGTPVAIITGRAVADARTMLGFAPRYLIGNHGAEGVPGYEDAAAGFARVCRGWLESLATDGAPWRTEPGVALEDKTCSLSLHYRHARNRRRTRQLLERCAQRLAPAPMLIDGKCVLNLIPPGAPHKGEALAALFAQSGCDHALYIGDDASDEAVFRLRSPAVLSVRVGHDRRSAADLYLRRQSEVPRFLRELVRMRDGRAAG
jgi:trehalose 6-phosphate phosphatase